MLEKQSSKVVPYLPIQCEVVPFNGGDALDLQQSEAAQIKCLGMEAAAIAVWREGDGYNLLHLEFVLSSVEPIVLL